LIKLRNTLLFDLGINTPKESERGLKTDNENSTIIKIQTLLGVGAGIGGLAGAFKGIF
jgi:hypothetical protein